MRSRKYLNEVLAAAMVAGGLMMGGAAVAQTSSTQPTASPPFSPSMTPNDSTATQPGTPPAPGRQPAAPTDAPAGGPPTQGQSSTGTWSSSNNAHMTGQGTPTSGTTMAPRHREINDNLPTRQNNQGGSPPAGYPNTGGSK
ncbi:Uncharacterised protein [Bordetella ansorpii]|uniref:Proteophosphoglycan ppg4 n=1 Tax=Bordetella ansorpii TaxID=288768 RepID=A0A157MCM7_9BORD|nr:hypothetical protein [Bordetella ansorpii]SAI06530.1 Uncharacterised protein [Bordetella ansorpii]